MASIHKEICEVCLKSGVFCPACEEKLENGILEKIDGEIAKYLENLKEKFKVLREAQIYKAFETKENIIILTRKGDASKLIGKNGSIVKLLSKEFKKHVKVVEFSKNIKEFINNLIFPANIEGVNIVYGKNGEIKYKIRISRNYSRKIDKNMLVKAVEIVFKSPVEIIMV